MEDIITDSVAEPVRLEPDWLPEEIRARDGSGGHLYAHAGIKAAADAVLKVWVFCIFSIFSNAWQLCYPSMHKQNAAHIKAMAENTLP